MRGLNRIAKTRVPTSDSRVLADKVDLYIGGIHRCTHSYVTDYYLLAKEKCVTAAKGD